jgi:ATP-dependent protease ClpP protease subunit
MAARAKDNLEYYFEYGVNPQTRTIYLLETVDELFAEYTIKALDVLSAKADPIRIIMNNFGGDELCGMGVYDYIKTMKQHITIDVFGHCMSMAAWILQSADERRMSKHAQLMVHVGYMELPTNHPEINKRWMKQYEKDEPLFEDLLLERIREKHPRFTRQKIRDILRFDAIYTASETVDLGLADKII